MTYYTPFRGEVHYPPPQLGNNVWKTASGRVLRWCEMTDYHLENCIRMLRRKAAEERYGWYPDYQRAWTFSERADQMEAYHRSRQGRSHYYGA